MNYLIDTDIIIYSLNNHENVNKNMKIVKNTPKSLSVITYGELIYGAEKRTIIDDMDLLIENSPKAYSY